VFINVLADGGGIQHTGEVNLLSLPEEMESFVVLSREGDEAQVKPADTSQYPESAQVLVVNPHVLESES